VDADEIVPLTAEAIKELLDTRRGIQDGTQGRGKRRGPRWAFPGAVEIWLPDGQGGERYLLGVCHNLTEVGIGVRCDEAVEIGATLAIAIHQPERSFHGRGLVRHCTPRGKGHLVGFEFVFER
jgi:hypothetical protein